TRPSSTPPLFPYTTLFRSDHVPGLVHLSQRFVRRCLGHYNLVSTRLQILGPGSTVTDFDRVIAISLPISSQTQIRQSSPAATERQPQRCTQSIPYCQRTIHDARPWPASIPATMLPRTNTVSHYGRMAEPVLVSLTF